MTKAFMSQRLDLIAQTNESLGQPVTVSSLNHDLKKLGIVPGMVLLVHSSMSSLGWVCGGAPAVIEALTLALGPEGTLVMPTHSAELSDPKDWRNPPVPESWWQTIRDEMPAFEKDKTPTRRMGVIAECFRQQQGVLRSNHPQVSFAARGPLAPTIVDGHMLEYCLGEGSPLARIYDLGGFVLLLGVGHGNNTSLHLAEYRATYPGKKSDLRGAPIFANGKRQWATYKDIQDDDSDFEDIGAGFETQVDKTTSQVSVGKVGIGQARLMSQPALVDFAAKYMEANRS
jgi:aminoglycoside 3-N-acetyltransferase